jgi:hypothetical protein
VRLAIREALLAFRRAPLLSALGVTTIAFSLFAFGLFSLVALNIRAALRNIEERVEVRAFLVDNAPGDSIAKLMEELSKRQDVQRVEYIDANQALERARAELGEFKDVFEAGFLPASPVLRNPQPSRQPLAWCSVSPSPPSRSSCQRVHTDDGACAGAGDRDHAARRRHRRVRAASLPAGRIRQGRPRRAARPVLHWAAHAVVSKSFLQTDFFPPVSPSSALQQRPARHCGERVFGPASPQAVALACGGSG